MSRIYRPDISEGATLIELPFYFKKGSNLLQVYLNGQKLILNQDYKEVTDTSFELYDPTEKYDDIECNLGVFPGTGSLTSANIEGGMLSVSFTAVNNQPNLTDLKLEVRDPDNQQIISNLQLDSYFNSGVYYKTINVFDSVQKLGTYLITLESEQFPDNAGSKVFVIDRQSVSTQSSQGGAVVQSARRLASEGAFVFRHIALTGLTDVTITIYNSSDVPIMQDLPMIEIGTTGVYKYSYNPPESGLYTGIMSSSSMQSTSVSEVIFESESSGPGSGGQVVISNKIGVGSKQRC